jgi:hypothetical protein
LEPVTLVRSPMFTNKESVPMETGSKPDSFNGSTKLETEADNNTHPLDRR